MNQAYNLIVAGGREFNDYAFAKRIITLVGEEYLHDKSVTIVSGMARGADALGYRFAIEHGVEVIAKSADWGKYGKRAGFIRNQEMNDISRGLLAFWDGQSRGTKHMIDIAKQSGRDVWIQYYGIKRNLEVPERFK